MSLTKRPILSLIFFVAVLLALPVAIFLTQQRLDIRPRALQGKANLLMSSDKNSSTVGGTIDVLVSLQLTQPGLKVSGIDFMILYDREKVDVINIVPALQTALPGGIFTEAPVVTSGGIFDETFNFLRVVELARMPSEFLPTTAVPLATITFRSIGEGSAVIKFPEDNQYMEIVGIEGAQISVTAGASISPTSTQQPPTNTPPPQPTAPPPQPTSPPPQPTSPPPEPTSPPCTGNCCNEGCHIDTSVGCGQQDGVCTGLGSCPADRPTFVGWCGCTQPCGSASRDQGACCRQ